MSASSRVEAETAAKGLLREYANSIHADITHAAPLGRNLTTTAQALAASQSKSRDDLGRIVTSMVEDNPDLLGVTLVFEPNALDGRDADFVGHAFSDATGGRFATYIYRNEAKQVAVEKLDMTDDAVAVWYVARRDAGHPVITPSYRSTAPASGWPTRTRPLLERRSVTKRFSPSGRPPSRTALQIASSMTDSIRLPFPSPSPAYRKNGYSSCPRPRTPWSKAR